MTGERYSNKVLFRSLEYISKLACKISLKFYTTSLWSKKNCQSFIQLPFGFKNLVSSWRVRVMTQKTGHIDDFFDFYDFLSFLYALLDWLIELRGTTFWLKDLLNKRHVLWSIYNIFRKCFYKCQCNKDKHTRCQLFCMSLLIPLNLRVSKARNSCGCRWMGCGGWVYDPSEKSLINLIFR